MSALSLTKKDIGLGSISWDELYPNKIADDNDINWGMIFWLENYIFLTQTSFHVTVYAKTIASTKTYSNFNHLIALWPFLY